MNKVPLEYDLNKYIHYNDRELTTYKKDLEKFLENKNIMNNIDFAKKVMMGQEIKSNNNIEGIKDEIESIEEIITHQKKNISTKEQRRIINLYNGYKYILNTKEINKDTLKKLYIILSKDILDDYSKEHMGSYYRKEPVYILGGSVIDNIFYKGISQHKINDYMNQLFHYINKDNNLNEIDTFIKSQIIHFYFVYIHPYYDVNGRTSRTLSMWYLLNQKNYSYMIFNRAISFAKNEYEKSIIKSRARGNITSFLKYMLIQVQKELEKEYLINNIKNNSKTSLNKEEEQIIEYFLLINELPTIKNLINIYNEYNPYLEPKQVFKEQIYPLIEKEIFKFEKNTSQLSLNKQNIDIEKRNLKYLKLQKYLKK